MTELSGEGRGVELVKKVFRPTKSQFAFELININFLAAKNQ